MNKLRNFLLIFAILAIISLACNAPDGETLSEEDKQATSVAETVAAQTSNNDDPAPQPPGPSATPEPTQTNQPTTTPHPTNTPQPTSTTIPCNRASFVSDVTYPDGSDVVFNESFVKTWRLQNNGSCDWTSGYKLVFSHGDRLNAPDEVTITSGTVAPGQTVDISVNLKAPGDQGTYKGYFKLKSPDGQVFGIGANGETAFWIEVEVFPDTPDVVIPKPEGTVSYREQLKCPTGSGDRYMLVFRVENTGTIPIKSASVWIKDHSTSEEFSNTNNLFGGASACISMAINELSPTQSAFVFSDYYKYQMIGDSVTASIKLCSEDNLGGECVEKILNFVE